MTRAEDRLVVCGWRQRRAPTAGNWYELIHAGVGPIAEPRPLADDPEAWVSLGRIRGATPSGGRNRTQPKASSARS